MDCQKKAKEGKVRCKLHPQMPIEYIYCKSNCSYPSRLACSICMEEYNSLGGFKPLKQVLKDPRVILHCKDQSEYGIYDLMNNYFDLMEHDPEEVLKLFKQGISRQIEKLEHDLKEGIEKYKLFRAELVKVKQQFNEYFISHYLGIGLRKIQTELSGYILKEESYHYGPEWNKLEETVYQFIRQFKEQNNQELKAAYSKIEQIEKNFLPPQLLSDFKQNTLKNVTFFCDQLNNLRNVQSQLCDNKYFDELIQRISKNKNVTPKVSLLFKGSEHGMNAQAFWGKCSNKGPTIVICKSKNGYVFGGYSPCKWIPNVSAYQNDDSKTSFLFSYTRKEIYPVVSAANAIYCQSNFGPTFGGNHNLNIAADFQTGYSNLNGQYYSNESYKIENSGTHLMGDSTPQLVEMEVFLIE